MTRIVARSWRSWVGAGIATLVVVGGLIWLWIIASRPVDEPIAGDPARQARSGSAPAWRGGSSRPVNPALPPPPAPPVVGPTPASSAGHTADPCTSLLDPVIPTGFEMETVHGITIAWAPAAPAPPRPAPYDVALQPVAAAYLTAGLLEEAARFTGTEPRDQLTVVVYPTREAMIADTMAPPWSGALYDGGAIRVPAKPDDDLGLEVSTLRHEVMHAQLHAAVGCMPAWFNEGVAMYFAGEVMLQEWFAMLREPPVLELGVLEASSILEASDEKAAILYAQSQAMVAFIVEQPGGSEVRAAVDAVRQAHTVSAQAGRELWQRKYPDVTPRAVLDHLAMKLFALPPGRELDRILAGAICCGGLRMVSELGCHGTAIPVPEPKGRFWLDRTMLPWSVCRVKW
jgi:hypothetical protein